MSKYCYSLIHRFADDNNLDVDLLRKELKNYISQIDRNEALAVGKEHITINNSAIIIVDGMQYKIPRQGLQAFTRFYRKPMPYAKYSAALKNDAKFRSILPNLFVCWYLDTCNDSEYVWSIFDGDKDYQRCIEAVIASYPKLETMPSPEAKTEIRQLEPEKILFGNGLEGFSKYQRGKSFFNYATQYIPDVFTYERIDSSVRDDLEELRDYLRKAAADVVREVEQQPLMAYLTQKGLEYLNEYRSLVNAIARYDGRRTVVSSPVEVLYNRVREQTARLTFGKDITAHDLLMTFGKWAVSASSDNENGKYYIADTSSETETIRINDICTETSDTWRILVAENGRYKFGLKQYRLIFEAIHWAEVFNDRLIGGQNTSDIVEQVTSAIINRSKNASRDHTAWSFDDLIVFSEALRMSLDGVLVVGVLNRLIEYTNDFSVKNRIYQERAIAALCYMLCEDRFLKTEYVEKIFRTTYGRSIYRFQIDVWTYLQRSSSIFVKTVAETYDNACRIEKIDSDFFSCSDPLFAFLYGALFDSINIGRNDTITDIETFCRYCCVLQHSTWRDVMHNKESTKVVEEILPPIRYLIEHAPQTEAITTATPYLVYGCNLLFYTIFDHFENGAIDVDKLKEAYSNAYRDIKGELPTEDRIIDFFIRMMILNDYFTRSLSRAYNKGYCNKGSQMCGDPNNNEMFLLCSSVRLASLPSLMDRLLNGNGRSRYDILANEKMTKRYEHYLSFEHGRYRLLLIRLLLLSNYFDKHDIPLTSDDLCGDDLFLEYDSVEPSDIAEMQEALSVSDTADRNDRLKKILVKSKK